MTRYDTIEELKKHGSEAKTFDEVLKYNPYHGWHGYFSTANAATSVSGRSGLGSSSDTALSGGRTGGADRKQRISAAQDRMKGSLKQGAEVSLSAMDPDLAERTADAVQKVMEKYPELNDSIKAITCEDERYWALNGNLIGSFDPVDKTIRLNPAIFGDRGYAEETWKGMLERKHHPEGTPVEAAVVHEMGHAFDLYISQRLFGGNFRDGNTMSQRLAEKEAKGRTDAEVEERLSGYATKNSAEMFAEGFSEYITSPNPRPMAKQLGDGFESYREQLNGVE